MFILRALGFLWSLPNTLFGLLWCTSFGPLRARWRWDGWVLEIHVAWLLDAPPVLVTTGQTISHVMLHIDEEPTPGLRRHERRHTWQGDLLGPLFVFAYFGAALVARLRGKHWYRDNWFEEDARRFAREERGT